MSPARPGDIATIYCDISSAKNDLNWTPEYGVEQICEHLHNWYLRSPNGYNWESVSCWQVNDEGTIDNSDGLIFQ
jgi:hypothetical protein